MEGVAGIVRAGVDGNIKDDGAASSSRGTDILLLLFSSHGRVIQLSSLQLRSCLVVFVNLWTMMIVPPCLQTSMLQLLSPTITTP